jgi:hypothetical protein
VFTLRTVANGFATDVRNVTVTAGQMTVVTVSLSPGGTVSGTVTTVLGAPISGATVEIRTGSQTTGAPLRTATTNASGVFTIGGLASGQYTLAISATGYNADTRAVTVTAPSTTNVGISLSPVGGAPAIQITVDWNTGEDLDAHLMLAGQQPFVFFGNLGNCAQVCLRTDDTDGFGPETIDFAVPQSMDLFFHVHHYDACVGSSLLLANSGAIVKVRINGVLQNTSTCQTRMARTGGYSRSTERPSPRSTPSRRRPRPT